MFQQHGFLASWIIWAWSSFNTGKLDKLFQFSDFVDHFLFYMDQMKVPPHRSGFDFFSGF